MKAAIARVHRLGHLALVALLTTTAGPVIGAPVAERGATKSVLITLGTMGGPIADPVRSQPANLLIDGDLTVLVDAGDGVAEQLAKAGIPIARVRTVFLTHLHYDHTGGLFALLGMRQQLALPQATVYGPPGTLRLVAGLIQAMQPAADIGAGLAGRPRRDPAQTIRTVEISGGETVQLGSVKVTAAMNSHYSFPAGSPEAQGSQSLSFRFELSDRSIAFTGDTGPSANVEVLAQGADVLVSEVIDPVAAMAALRGANPELPAAALANIASHFTEQHLSAAEVGKLAARAGVKRVILTHNPMSAADSVRASKTIRSLFAGDVDIARDLARY